MWLNLAKARMRPEVFRDICRPSGIAAVAIRRGRLLSPLVICPLAVEVTRPTLLRSIRGNALHPLRKRHDLYAKQRLLVRPAPAHSHAIGPYRLPLPHVPPT